MIVEVFKRNEKGKYTKLYEVKHCSHASAAGAFQIKETGSVITKHTNESTELKHGDDYYMFKDKV